MVPEGSKLVRIALTIVFSLTLLSVPRSAAAGPSRLRPVDERTARLVAEGLAGSPAVRSLADRLARTNLIVYVEYGQLPVALVGRVALIGTSGPWRYLRIQIDCRQNRLSQLMALGHELQHAVEIGEAGAVDAKAVQRLYAAIGFATGPRQFETVAAERTGMLVRHELLWGSPRREMSCVNAESEAWGERSTCRGPAR